ncbi:MAG: C50 carotenoid epsilon cyclase [Smithella sp.]|jgi:signal transduction histidine kinase|nr:cache domain-containing protein [Smithellaceae bacterium]NLA40389.1 C50 carotenoid epsilon cyclase [Smithella sp.]
MIFTGPLTGKALKKVLLLVPVALFILAGNQGLAAGQNSACTKEILHAVIHTSGLSLGELLKGVADETGKKDMIRTFVKAVRFFPDDSGYIYVYTLDGVVVGHGGMPGLEGKNLIDHRDARGFYDVRMAIATAKKGGGFFEHYWPRPGGGGEFRKLTYVEMIAGTNYFIGAGAYVP